MNARYLAVPALLLSVACVPADKFSPTRPAPVPAQASDYEAAVASWMAPGAKTAGPGWATYEFSAEDVLTAGDLEQELRAGFADLCARFDGKTKPASATGLVDGPDHVCTKGEQSLFAATVRIGDPEVVHGHFTAIRVRRVAIHHYDAEDLKNQRDAQDGAAEAKRVKQEADAARSAELTEQVRANLQPGDFVLVEVASDLVDVETGARTPMGNKRVEALVLEVKPPLVHVQVSRPTQALWVRIESIHHAR